MGETKRPEAVSVIGWIWIIIGARMCFSAVENLLSHLTAWQAIASFPHMGNHRLGFSGISLFLLIGQPVAGVVGIVSGASFLKLRAWARSVLDALTWLCLASLVGFGVYWTIEWCDITRAGGMDTLTTLLGIAGVLGKLAFYGVLLGILLKYVRCTTVKEAMR